MRPEWEFQGSPKGWCWRSTDADTSSMIVQSQRLFQTLFDCVKDAQLQGYRSRSGEKRVYRLEPGS
jgi:hypothetical protein